MSDCEVELSIVLVSWNTAALTLRALESLPAASAGLAVQCICVDNASRDGTVARIRSEHPDVQVLLNGTNKGYARAANQALPLLTGRYTCFLNSDARPRRGALAHLVHWLDEHPDAVIAAPRLIDEEDRPHVVARPEPSRLALLHESTVLAAGRLGRHRARAWRTGLGSDAPRAVPNIVGACLVIRTGWIRSLGGFDADYVFYWEDTDLCRAVRQRGGSVWLVPDGPAVEHIGGASTPRACAAIRIAFLAGIVRYVRKGSTPASGAAFASVAVLGFWLNAWRKGGGLPVRAIRRHLCGRSVEASRSWSDARSWIEVIERQGPTLLRLLRRPTTGEASP